MPADKNKPKFEQGQTVYNSLLERDVTIKDVPPVWNGFTWMYSFEGEVIRSGEMYLVDVSEVGK